MVLPCLLQSCHCPAAEKGSNCLSPAQERSKFKFQSTVSTEYISPSHHWKVETLKSHHGKMGNLCLYMVRCTDSSSYHLIKWSVSTASDTVIICGKNKLDVVMSTRVCGRDESEYKTLQQDHGGKGQWRWTETVTNSTSGHRGNSRLAEIWKGRGSSQREEEEMDP